MRKVKVNKKFIYEAVENINESVKEVNFEVAFLIAERNSQPRELDIIRYENFTNVINHLQSFVKSIKKSCVDLKKQLEAV